MTNNDALPTLVVSRGGVAARVFPFPLTPLAPRFALTSRPRLKMASQSSHRIWPFSARVNAFHVGHTASTRWLAHELALYARWI